MTDGGTDDSILATESYEEYCVRMYAAGKVPWPFDTWSSLLEVLDMYQVAPPPALTPLSSVQPTEMRPPVGFADAFLLVS